MHSLDFPGGPVVKNLPANAGDVGSIPGMGRFHMPLRSHTLEAGNLNYWAHMP